MRSKLGFGRIRKPATAVERGFRLVASIEARPVETIRQRFSTRSGTIREDRARLNRYGKNIETVMDFPETKCALAALPSERRQ
jgi:hypothetical protein